MTWQGVFLGGQLTIIAVVYPLVVGFISVLFQDKSAKTIIFPVYKKYSGFMFAGLSGMAFAIFIIGCFFLRSFLDDITYSAFCIASAIWLFCNILMTAWFFTKTFIILNDESRNELITRFSIQEACISDISSRLKISIIKNSKGYDLLKEKDSDILSADSYSYSYSEIDFSKITKKVKDKYEISNINYTLINTAIYLQTLILKVKKIEKCEIFIQPYKQEGSIYILAKYNGFKINPIVKFLIIISFTFEKTKIIDNDKDLMKNFDSFIQPLYEALKNNNPKGFENAVENLVTYHTTISEVLSFIDDDNLPTNWLLLSSNSFWGRTYFRELLNEYYQLAKEAIDKMPDNTSFYKEILYLHKRLYANRENITSIEVVEFIQGNYYLWELLLTWRSFENTLSLRAHDSYEEIIYNFISSWESWPRFYIELKTKRSYDVNNTLLAFLTHLKLTSATSISAIRFNNYDAAGWGVDMLNYWLEHLGTKDYFHEEYAWKSVLINHTILKLKPTSKIWENILNGEKFLMEAAYDLAIKNAHIDLRVLCACYLLLKPKSLEKEEKDILKQYVLALLEGKRIHSSNDLYPVNPISHAGELVGVYFRLRDYTRSGSDSYGAWLNSVLEYYGKIFKERLVMGRIYSGWGANGVKSLDIAFIQIVLSRSQHEWRLPREWYEALKSNYFKRKDIESLIYDLNDWINCVEKINNSILIEEDNYELLRENFIKSINAILLDIQLYSNQSIIDAPIDQERLNEMAHNASTIFEETNPPFPMNLFNIDRRYDNPPTNFSGGVNLRAYPKQYIAKDIESVTVANEDLAIQEDITNNLKLNIFKEIINYSLTNTKTYDSFENIISGILKEIKAIQSPILFIGNQNLKNRLRKLKYQPDLEGINFIKYKENFGDRYICHIGQCEVYSLPFSDIDYCILTSKNIFDKLIYFKLNPNSFVDINYLQDEANPLEGDLKLSYKIEVALKPSQIAIKLLLEENK